MGERAATGGQVPQAGGIRARNGAGGAVDVAVRNAAAGAAAADGAVCVAAAACASDPRAARAAAARVGDAPTCAAPRGGHADTQDAPDDGECGAAAGAAARICRTDAEGTADPRIDDGRA